MPSCRPILYFASMLVLTVSAFEPSKPLAEALTMAKAAPASKTRFAALLKSWVLEADLAKLDETLATDTAPSATLLRAQLAALSDEFSKARLLADEGVAASPKSPAALLVRARLHAVMTDFDKSIADLEKARSLSAAPSLLAEIERLLGGEYIRSNQVDKGLAMLKSGMDRMDSFEAKLPYLYVVEDEGLHGAAANWCKELAALAEDGEKTKWCCRGVRHLLESGSSAAVEEAEAVLLLNPDDTVASLALKMLERALRQLPEKEREGRKIEILHKACSGPDSSAILLQAYALELVAAGNTKLATDIAFRAIKRQPGSRDVCMLFYTLLEIETDKGRAKKMLDELLEADPKNAAPIGLKLRYLASIETSAQVKKEAEHLFSQHHDREAYCRVARYLAGVEKIAAAEMVYQLAAARFDTPQALAEAAEVYLIAGRTEKAMALFHEIAKTADSSLLAECVESVLDQVDAKTAQQLLLPQVGRFRGDGPYARLRFELAAELDQTDALSWGLTWLAKDEKAVLHVIGYALATEQTNSVVSSLQEKEKRTTSETRVLAHLLAETGDVDGALALLTDDAFAVDRQVLMAKNDRWQALLQETREAFGNKPDVNRGNEICGYMLALGQVEDLLKFAKAWQAQPEAPAEAWLWQANVLNALLKRERAGEVVREGIQRFPDDTRFVKFVSRQRLDDRLLRAKYMEADEERRRARWQTPGRVAPLLLPRVLADRLSPRAGERESRALDVWLAGSPDQKSDSLLRVGAASLRYRNSVVQHAMPTMSGNGIEPTALLLQTPTREQIEIALGSMLFHQHENTVKGILIDLLRNVDKDLYHAVCAQLYYQKNRLKAAARHFTALMTSVNTTAPGPAASSGSWLSGLAPPAMVWYAAHERYDPLTARTSMRRSTMPFALTILQQAFRHNHQLTKNPMLLYAVGASSNWFRIRDLKPWDAFSDRDLADVLIDEDGADFMERYPALALLIAARENENGDGLPERLKQAMEAALTKLVEHNDPRERSVIARYGAGRGLTKEQKMKLADYLALVPDTDPDATSMNSIHSSALTLYLNAGAYGKAVVFLRKMVELLDLDTTTETGLLAGNLGVNNRISRMVSHYFHDSEFSDGLRKAVEQQPLRVQILLGLPEAFVRVAELLEADELSWAECITAASYCVQTKQRKPALTFGRKALERSHTPRNRAIALYLLAQSLSSTMEKDEYRRTVLSLRALLGKREIAKHDYLTRAEIDKRLLQSAIHTSHPQNVSPVFLVHSNLARAVSTQMNRLHNDPRELNKQLSSLCHMVGQLLILGNGSPEWIYSIRNLQSQYKRDKKTSISVEQLKPDDSSRNPHEWFEYALALMFVGEREKTWQACRRVVELDPRYRGLSLPFLWSAPQEKEIASFIQRADHHGLLTALSLMLQLETSQDVAPRWPRALAIILHTRGREVASVLDVAILNRLIQEMKRHELSEACRSICKSAMKHAPLRSKAFALASLLHKRGKLDDSELNDHAWVILQSNSRTAEGHSLYNLRDTYRSAEEVVVQHAVKNGETDSLRAKIKTLPDTGKQAWLPQLLTLYEADGPEFIAAYKALEPPGANKSNENPLRLIYAIAACLASEKNADLSPFIVDGMTERAHYHYQAPLQRWAEYLAARKGHAECVRFLEKIKIKLNELDRSPSNLFRGLTDNMQTLLPAIEVQDDKETLSVSWHELRDQITWDWLQKAGFTGDTKGYRLYGINSQPLIYNAFRYMQREQKDVLLKAAEQHRPQTFGSEFLRALLQNSHNDQANQMIALMVKYEKEIFSQENSELLQELADFMRQGGFEYRNRTKGSEKERKVMQRLKNLRGSIAVEEADEFLQEMKIEGNLSRSFQTRITTLARTLLPEHTDKAVAVIQHATKLIETYHEQNPRRLYRIHNLVANVCQDLPSSVDSALIRYRIAVAGNSTRGLNSAITVLRSRLLYYVRDYQKKHDEGGETGAIKALLTRFAELEAKRGIVIPAFTIIAGNEAELIPWFEERQEKTSFYKRNLLIARAKLEKKSQDLEAVNKEFRQLLNDKTYAANVRFFLFMKLHDYLPACSQMLTLPAVRLFCTQSAKISREDLKPIRMLVRNLAVLDLDEDGKALVAEFIEFIRTEQRSTFSRQYSYPSLRPVLAYLALKLGNEAEAAGLDFESNQSTDALAVYLEAGKIDLFISSMEKLDSYLATEDEFLPISVSRSKEAREAVMHLADPARRALGAAVVAVIPVYGNNAEAVQRENLKLAFNSMHGIAQDRNDFSGTYPQHALRIAAKRLSGNRQEPALPSYNEAQKLLANKKKEEAVGMVCKVFQAIANSRYAIDLSPHSLVRSYTVDRWAAFVTRSKLTDDVLSTLETRKATTEELFALAFATEQLKSIEPAIPLYEQVLRRDPQHPGANFALAIAFATESPERAKQHFSQLILVDLDSTLEKAFSSGMNRSLPDLLAQGALCALLFDLNLPPSAYHYHSILSALADDIHVDGTRLPELFSDNEIPDKLAAAAEKRTELYIQLCGVAMQSPAHVPIAFAAKLRFCRHFNYPEEKLFDETLAALNRLPTGKLSSRTGGTHPVEFLALSATTEDRKKKIREQIETLKAGSSTARNHALALEQLLALIEADPEQFPKLAASLQLPHWPTRQYQSRVAIKRLCLLIRLWQAGNREFAMAPWLAKQIAAMLTDGNVNQGLEAWFAAAAESPQLGSDREICRRILNAAFSKEEIAKIESAADGSINQTVPQYHRLSALEDLGRQVMSSGRGTFAMVEVWSPILVKRQSSSANRWAESALRSLRRPRIDYVRTLSFAQNPPAFRIAEFKGKLFPAIFVEKLDEYGKKSLLRDLNKIEEKGFGNTFLEALLQESARDRGRRLCSFMIEQAEAIKSLPEVTRERLNQFVAAQVRDLPASTFDGLADGAVQIANQARMQGAKQAIADARKYLDSEPAGKSDEVLIEAIALAKTVLMADAELANQIVTHAAKTVQKKDKNFNDWREVKRKFDDDTAAGVLTMAAASGLESLPGFRYGREMIKGHYNKLKNAKDSELRKTVRSSRERRGRAVHHALDVQMRILKLAEGIVVPLLYSHETYGTNPYPKDWVSELPEGPLKQQLEIFVRIRGRDGRDRYKLSKEDVDTFKAIIGNPDFSASSRIYFFAVLSNEMYRYEGTEELIASLCPVYVQTSEELLVESELDRFFRGLYLMRDMQGWQDTAQKVCKHAHAQLIKGKEWRASTRVHADLIRLAFLCGLDDLGKSIFVESPVDAHHTLGLQAAILYSGDADWCRSKLPEDLEKASRSTRTPALINEEARETANQVLAGIEDETRRLFFDLFYSACVSIRDRRGLYFHYRQQDERMRDAMMAIGSNTDKFSPETLEQVFSNFQRYRELEKAMRPIILTIGRKLDLQNLLDQRSDNQNKQFAHYIIALTASGKLEDALKAMAPLKTKTMDSRKSYSKRRLFVAIKEAVDYASMRDLSKESAAQWWTLTVELSKIAAEALEDRYASGIVDDDMIENMLIIALMAQKEEELVNLSSGELKHLFEKQKKRLNDYEIQRALTQVDFTQAQSEAFIPRYVQIRAGAFQPYFRDSIELGIERLLYSNPFRNNYEKLAIKAITTLWQINEKDARKLADRLSRRGSQEFKKQLEKIQKGELPVSLPMIAAHEGQVAAVRWTEAGTLMTVGADNKVCIWELPNKRLRTIETDDKTIRTAAVSPDGNWAATTAAEGKVRLYNLQKPDTETPEFAVADKRVTELMFTPDSRKILATALDSSLSIWTLDGKAQTRFTVKRGLRTLDCSSDGKHVLAAGLGRKIYVWDRGSEKEIAVFAGHTFGIRCAAFSPAGNRVVSGSDDMTLRVWDIERKSDPVVLQGHSSLVTACAFLDKETVVSCSYDGTVRTWHAGSGKEIRKTQVANEGVSALALSQDGKSLAVGGRNGRVYILTVADLLKPGNN